ncbi:hypothetical protein MN116_005503 [Schistosoma mekongi]|uniref:Peripheral-type benzodiazepine receptor-associated protein 1 n=1 Tax=Schistosoma mekongi TaxID=38744 RepID=A0AAE1ZCN4_SCHME|nr:hypothetical protein MN116_005503 [Schistosoma mekongi]
MSYECQMEKTLQKLHDVIQLRQQLLHERATLKLQLDKLLQRSVNNVEVIVDDVDDDGQIQSDNSQLHINQENDDSKSKDTVEQIQLKIKELEKRCALQLLRHEEILLEIEDVRKRSCTNHNNSPTILTSINSSVHNQLNDMYTTTETLATTSTSTSCIIDIPSNLSLNKLNTSTKVHGRLLQSGKQYNMKKDYLPMNEINSLLDQTEMNNEFNRQITSKHVKGRLFRSNTELQISEGDDPNLVELFQVIEEPSKSTDVPAPRMITLERQLFQSVLISWKAPDISLMNENKIVSAYHIYVDGQFRLAVMSKEKTRALIDNVDADKPHRISIRSISSHGQSKDAQCTLVVGRGMTATPARLKATQIGTKSAKLSWIPGNSNYYHRVYLNECSLHLCKPGVYKLHLTDLPPDTLHRVCVQALPSPINIQETVQQPPAWINSGCTGVYTQKLAAFIEFRTLPIGLPDPPSHVQIEPGPQDGMLLITWLPVPQDKGAADAVTAAGAGCSLPVQGYTVCLNGQAIMEMNGASRDHAILKLSTIRDHIQRLINNSTQSSLSYDNTNLLLNQSNSSKFSNSLLNSNTFTTSSIIELYITVHSTVPFNSLHCNLQNTLSQSNSELSYEQDSNISKHCTLLKGSEGPASKPIHLTACLLIAAAGSLETAYTVFGPNLATKLGINENTARMAGVSLSLDDLHNSTACTNNHVENIISDDDHGLLVVSAESVVRKPSPTADALGSAEALLLRRKFEKQELRDKDDVDDDKHLSPDPNSMNKLNNFNQNIKHKNNLHQSFGHTSYLQKSPTDKYYHYPRVDYPHNPKHSKYRWRQTRSISDDYELNLKYGLPKDVYYSDDASLNSSASSESSKAPGNNRWFRTSSSYNLTADYPNRRWKPRGVIRSNMDRGYPHEYHESLTMDRLNRKEGIRRKHLRKLYDNKIYPVYKEQHTGHFINHPQSFKSHTYSERISPETKQDILSKYGTTKRLFDLYPNSRYSKHEINQMSSSSNDERYPDSILNNRNYFSQPDYFNKIPFPNILTSQTCLINTRSRSTSPKRLHQLNATLHPSRNIEMEYNFPNIPIHRTSRHHHHHQHHHPLPLGNENRRRPIRERYYSAHSNPHENLSLPEIQITRNSSLSDNEPQFQTVDHYQQQQPSQYPYQNIRGPTRPIRSRFMDTRRHGSYDPQLNHANFSAARHDPDYSRPMAPLDQYTTSGPKRPLYHNIMSPPSGPITQPEYRTPFNQGNVKNYRPGDPGNGSRQAAIPQQQPQQLSLQYSRTSKPFVHNEQQYSTNQRNISNDYSNKMGHTESKPIRVVVALYDYDPTTMSPNIDGAQEELPFREGQLIKILTECDEDGFYLGECNGLRGLVPSNMVSELDSDPLKSQKINSSVDSRSNLTDMNHLPPIQVSKTRSMDINSYGQINSSTQNYYGARKYDQMISQAHSVPRNTDFINEHVFHSQVIVPSYSEMKDLYKDDIIHGRNLFHQQSQSKYNTEIMHTSRIVQSKSIGESDKQQNNQQSKIMIAIYDYDPHVLSPNADIDAELAFHSGEQITIFGDMDDDGFYYGETKDGRRGLVPSNFLQSCTNEINFSNKQNNSSILSPQLSSTTPRDYDRQRISKNKSMNNKEQAYCMDPNNPIVNSERNKPLYNTQSSSPCLQTEVYAHPHNNEVIDMNMNPIAHNRNELDIVNGIERFPENEDNPVIVMDLNPTPNNSHRKSTFSKGLSHGSGNDNLTKDYDTTYSTGDDSTNPNYSQRRRSTIRNLFKRE